MGVTKKKMEMKETIMKTICLKTPRKELRIRYRDPTQMKKEKQRRTKKRQIMELVLQQCSKILIKEKIRMEIKVETTQFKKVEVSNPRMTKQDLKLLMNLQGTNLKHQMSLK